MGKSTQTCQFITLIALFASTTTAAEWNRHRITLENLPGELHVTDALEPNDVLVLANNKTRMFVDVELNETNELGIFRNVRIEWQASGLAGLAALTSSVWVETTRNGGRAILDFLDGQRKRIAVGNHPGQFNATYQLGAESESVTHDGARSGGGGSFLVQVDNRGENATLQLFGDHVSLNRNTVDGFRVVEAHLVDVGDVAHSGTVVLVPAGDTDSDGDVDLQDFLTLSAKFGGNGDWEDGSFDYDGKVGFGDFLDLSANFGHTPKAAAVPEPSSWVSLGIALLSLRRRSGQS